MLIDPVQWERFIEQTPYYSKANIKQFAQEIGIAPGIVVGRLQHEKRLRFDHCNELKRHLEWSSGEQSS